MIARLDITLKTTEQNRIVRTGKSEAEVTITVLLHRVTAVCLFFIKVLQHSSNNREKLLSKYCTIEAKYWQTRSIERPLCDSRATCLSQVRVYLKYFISHPLHQPGLGGDSCKARINPPPLRVRRYQDYSAISNNMNLVHWLLMSVLLHLVQQEGDWAGQQSTQAPPHCTKCNNPSINGQCTNRHIAV